MVMISAFLMVLACTGSGANPPLSSLDRDPVMSAALQRAAGGSSRFVLVKEFQHWTIHTTDLHRSIWLTRQEAAELLAHASEPQQSAREEWDRFCRPPSCRLVGLEELAELARTESGKDLRTDWPALQRKYGADRAIELGAFAIVGNKAIVYWSEERGFLNSRLVVSVLWKSETGWRVVEHFEIVVS
ncbi:MAG TPA: hypothetical protein VHR45_07490 [Thermoanaerobaculia bacterium]|nr:hypothetical protein [Thermoanaerobaculia bacterium]